MNGEETIERLRYKAAQEYELAGLAYMDGDRVDGVAHTRKAKKYEEQIKELLTN